MTSLPREFVFVSLHGGKVHVVAGDPEDPDIADAPLRRIGDGPTDPIAALLGLTLTRCGRTISRHGNGGMDTTAVFVSSFADDRLCGACHRTVPEDEQHRLFEHPQTDD